MKTPFDTDGRRTPEEVVDGHPMHQKEVYESLSAVASALPGDHREEFGALMDELTRCYPGSLNTMAARRWLKDAGYVER